jgi:uncharacterized protein (DUF2252 family)
MMESPFAFFRGTAIVQAHDLSRTTSAGIVVQSCGDCHLMNFGGFASPERTLVFDINDFDETLPAPFEWDLKRLATSFVLATRWRKFSRGDARATAEASLRAYRVKIAELANMTVLDAWYSRVTFDDLMDQVRKDAQMRKRLSRVVRTANQRTSEAVFHKITHKVRGKPRIVDEPPLLYHSHYSETTQDVIGFFDAYKNTLPLDRRLLFERYQFVDAAFKVVGVGSVGTLCFVTLWMADNDDPLFLQIKQARPSVLAGLAGPSTYKNDGERVVVGQRLMQSASDIFLGWTRGPRGLDFYVRQLRDHKVALELATTTPQGLSEYARVCGETLARAHARSGKASEINGYIGSSGKFDNAISEYATAYADQVEKDFEAFRSATRSGRFPTETSGSEAETAVR